MVYAKHWDIYNRPDPGDRFMNILKSAADSPEQLRAGDVYRVLDEAKDHGIEDVFAGWLLKQNLMERTRFSLRAARGQA